MITFQNVSKSYSPYDPPALNDISLKVEPGEFVFLVGPSGSGKSTFLRLIFREDVPTSGDVLILGRSLRKMSKWRIPRLRRGMGVVFQDFRLLPDRTVYDNVAFALAVVGRKQAHIDKVVPEVLDLVGLLDKTDRMPNELSGGEQQRVAIARAFVNRPHVLIADEPTGNLDPVMAEEIVSLLDRINRTGTTVVMATHNAEIVNQMNKRVIQLQEGRVVRDESGGNYSAGS